MNKTCFCDQAVDEGDRASIPAFDIASIRNCEPKEGSCNGYLLAVEVGILTLYAFY